MKKLTLLVAAPLAVLAACAGTPTANTTSSYAPMSTQYCQRDRLTTEGDALVCNWAASVSAACDGTSATTVRKSTVAKGPANAGRCSDGRWLVSVTTQ
ncbi:MAG TPA: hypothetical protein VM122_04385 [Usitatibacter sp.]|nr:hypothetical protein [Usitatibacter sp.]